MSKLPEVDGARDQAESSGVQFCSQPPDKLEQGLDIGRTQAVTFSPGGQRDQHGDTSTLSHCGAAQGRASGHPIPRAISAREHHHPFQDFFPRAPEPACVQGKHLPLPGINSSSSHNRASLGSDLWFPPYPVVNGKLHGVILKIGVGASERAQWLEILTGKLRVMSSSAGVPIYDAQRGRPLLPPTVSESPARRTCSKSL